MFKVDKACFIRTHVLKVNRHIQHKQALQPTYMNVDAASKLTNIKKATSIIDLARDPLSEPTDKQ